MDTSSPNISASNDTLDGQVCDRCRQKKIRCDGISSERSSCSNCTIAGVKCQVSARLQRKTKSRGYTASSSNQSTIKKLERENDELRTQLQAEIETSNALQQELGRHRDRVASGTRPRKLQKLTEESNSNVQSPHISLSGGSEGSALHLHRSACVIKHMGRMVFDHTNVGRFAGSTTGIHFVASVEDLCRQTFPGLRPFPMDCFRLHLFQPKQHTATEYSDASTQTILETVRTFLNNSVEYYIAQVDHFNAAWLAFCPVVPRGTFIKDIRSALEVIHLQTTLDSRSSSTILAMITIRLINKCWLDHRTTKDHIDDTAGAYMTLACRLHPQVTAAGDLASLQAIILFSFYLQLAGHTSWLIPMNGIQVRLAQSLGLHRHARRFRFSVSETELRKRMWWWVYGFDKLTSLIHGLPQLINEDDVDNDLPIDCHLNEIDTNELSHPLPGEPSSVVLYIQSINLSKLIASILSQLYTTNQRRGGEAKITRLDRDLRVWHQNFNSALQRHARRDSYIIARLDILVSLAFILVHRPALTFDPSTQRFRESLKECVKASAYMIQLVSTSQTHQWALEMFPLGASIIFQCALLHVFHALHTDLVLSASATSPLPSDRAMVVTATDVLDAIVDRSEGGGSSGGIAAVTATISLLQMLSRTFLESGTENSDGQAVEVIEEPDPGIVLPSSEQLEDAESLGMDFWNLSALGSLNQLDVFDGGYEDAISFEHHVA